MTTPFELDVRTVRARERHPAIFEVIESLPRGASIVLVSDRDPLHLRRQLELRVPGAFRWAYLESGPVVWRVSIAKR